METEIINIFQSLAYPVAVSVVLFCTTGYFVKKIMLDIQNRDSEAKKLRDQYIAYLQDTHSELVTAIKENANAARENAAALNRFSLILEKLEKKFSV